MASVKCDAHLKHARLGLAEGDKDEARRHVAEARRLVDETGYGRRRPEVEALEAEVRSRAGYDRQCPPCAWVPPS